MQWAQHKPHLSQPKLHPTRQLLQICETLCRYRAALFINISELFSTKYDCLPVPNATMKVNSHTLERKVVISSQERNISADEYFFAHLWSRNADIVISEEWVLISKLFKLVNETLICSHPEYQRDSCYFERHWWVRSAEIKNCYLINIIGTGDAEKSGTYCLNSKTQA